jgi:hypothetical protein
MKSFALLLYFYQEQNKDAASQVYLQIEIARLHLFLQTKEQGF